MKSYTGSLLRRYATAKFEGMDASPQFINKQEEDEKRTRQFGETGIPQDGLIAVIKIILDTIRIGTTKSVSEEIP